MLPSAPYDRAGAALLKARTNVIYYGLYVKRLERCDFWLRVGGAFLASGGVATVDHFLSSKLATGMIGVVSAVVGCAGMAVQFGNRIKAATKIATQYVNVETALQRMMPQGDEVNVTEVEEQIDELSRLRKLEIEELSYHSRDLLKQAEKQAYEELGVPWVHD